MVLLLASPILRSGLPLVLVLRALPAVWWVLAMCVVFMGGCAARVVMVTIDVAAAIDVRVVIVVVAGRGCGVRAGFDVMRARVTCCSCVSGCVR